MNAAQWSSGFWADRFRLCHEVILPKMKEALEHPDNRARLSNFRVAAGIEVGGHQGTNWSDGDCYKWIEAMAHVCAIAGDDGLDREMDHWVELIGRSQDEDGYLCTQVQLDPGKERWGATIYHELYNMGHLMTAACVHHRATGKDTFLAVARRLADYLYGVFEPRPAELANFGWNPSNIMGLVDLYRATGEARYLELAGIFVDMRGSKPKGGQWHAGHGNSDGTDQNQDRVALRKEIEAVGHAVTATYLYAGAADVYAETGEGELMDALTRIWQDVTSKRMFVTGAVGAHHHTVSKRGDRVWEAFGLDYQLPNRIAYNETCSNIGNAMWNWRLLNLTGEAKYADVMELVLYNSALSAMDVDGTRFCYTNPLARQTDGTMLSNDTPERWSEHHCYCCPPQVARTLAKVHEWAYSTSDEVLWVNLYGSNTLDTELPGKGRLELTQETDYPWEGRVTIMIGGAPRGQFSIMLRVPGWADGADVSVNGEPVDVEAEAGAYAAIEREWRAGDQIVFDIAMRPRLMASHPEVEETHNHVAVMRGPVVYCLESVDLPEGVAIHEVHVSRDVDLSARHDGDLLAGVTVLEGQAGRVPSADWGGKLYQELSVPPPEPFTLRLIPYYAWLNRGRCDMRVWLPLC